MKQTFHMATRYPPEWIERVKKFDRREWPILCNSCGDIVDARVKEFLDLSERYGSPERALNEMNIYHDCTRYAFLFPYNVDSDYFLIGSGGADATMKINVANITTPFSHDFKVDQGQENEEISPLTDLPTSISVPTINQDPKYPDYVSHEVYGNRKHASGATFLCHYSHEN